MPTQVSKKTPAKNRKEKRQIRIKSEPETHDETLQESSTLSSIPTLSGSSSLNLKTEDVISNKDLLSSNEVEDSAQKQKKCRNRNSAVRHRLRRKEIEEQLRSKADELLEERKRIQRDVAGMVDMRFQLKSLLMQHSLCNYAPIDNYHARSAQFVTEKSGLGAAWAAKQAVAEAFELYNGKSESNTDSGSATADTRTPMTEESSATSVEDPNSEGSISLAASEPTLEVTTGPMLDSTDPLLGDLSLDVNMEDACRSVNQDADLDSGVALDSPRTPSIGPAHERFASPVKDGARTLAIELKKPTGRTQRFELATADTASHGDWNPCMEPKVGIGCEHSCLDQNGRSIYGFDQDDPSCGDIYGLESPLSDQTSPWMFDDNMTDRDRGLDTWPDFPPTVPVGDPASTYLTDCDEFFSFFPTSQN